MKNILLMGNPNVGKSVVFSRLTGLHAISSNYPGTTVGFSQGTMPLAGEDAQLVDVPGTYGLEATCKAEEVALEMLGKADGIINVVDATNLERSLHLTLHLLEQGAPMVVALNIWDDACHKGIEIDVPKLERELGVPVTPTVAVTGHGIKELVARLEEFKSDRSDRSDKSDKSLSTRNSELGAQKSQGRVPRIPPHFTEEQRWAEVGRIVAAAQSLHHRHHTLLEFIGDITVRPATGIPIAAVMLALSFLSIRVIGEGLIGWILDPGFETLWKPVLVWLSGFMNPDGLLHTILIGNLINGQIDFIQSFGMLSTGLFVGMGMVLPYVFAFYLVLGFLEDFGYLPRLAVLLDTLMHRLGLHGWAVIPMLLGFGCNVPGIMATRVLESRRERLIASTLVSVAVPCASLQAMMWAILGPYGARYVAMVYGTLFVVWIVIGRVLNRLMAGDSPELIMEIPPYRLPPPRALALKLWMRMRSYFIDAVPYVMLGVLAVNILHYFKAFDALANVAAPVFTRAFGLPKEAVLAVLVGFFRKDVAVGMLSSLHLTPGQLVVSVTVLAMSFPCVATFVILGKELGVTGLLKSFAIMLGSSLIVGAALNLIMN